MISKSRQEPTDSPDSEPQAEAVEALAEPVEATAQARTELEAARSETEQWRDRFLRKAAEFENFRKRSDRERAEAANLIKSSVLVELLPVLDACERALRSFDSPADQPVKLQTYRDGFELLHKQLSDTLNRLGVVPFEVRGEKFDPHRHEALGHLETLEHEDNTVIEELRRGYLYKDRLLRPAQVVVASRPKPPGEENPSRS
jgi:molecular chaperone GrpE